MPEFTYTALARDGHKEESTIEAASVAAAGHMLKEQGLLPTEIKAKSGSSQLSSMLDFSPISLNEKLAFIQNLSVMMKAGISVSRGLQIQAKQSKNKRFAGILDDVHSLVEGGKGLGEAMIKYPAVFSNIFTSMVKMGELSGSLDKSLEYLGVQLQREADLRSKIRGAMIYPSVIVSAMIIIGVLMSIYVLPSLTASFVSSGEKLPVTTRMVVAFAGFMSGHSILAVGGLIALSIGGYVFLKTKIGQRSLDWFLLHFMVLSKLDKKINIARFSRVLSSLLKSGIPIVEALEVSGESLDNSYFRDLVLDTSQNVKVGKPLSQSLSQNTKLFPDLIIQMLEVGEESGTTAEILEQLASHYEAEVDDTLKNMSSIIEPLLLLIIGAVVGLLAVSLIGPIYGMDQAASS